MQTLQRNQASVNSPIFDFLMARSGGGPGPEVGFAKVLNRAIPSDEPSVAMSRLLKPERIVGKPSLGITSGWLVTQEFLESFRSLRGLIRTQFPTSKL
jgi:hypothetical protein